MLQNFGRHIQFPNILERDRSQNKKKQRKSLIHYTITLRVLSSSSSSSIGLLNYNSVG